MFCSLPEEAAATGLLLTTFAALHMVESAREAEQAAALAETLATVQTALAMAQAAAAEHRLRLMVCRAQAVLAEQGLF